METRTFFNPVQLHLLKMFAVNGDEHRLNEMKDVLCNYYQQKLDNKLNKLWDEGVITLDKLEEIKHSHLRTAK